jgi:hypothetical protein
MAQKIVVTTQLGKFKNIAVEGEAQIIFLETDNENYYKVNFIDGTNAYDFSIHNQVGY